MCTYTCWCVWVCGPFVCLSSACQTGKSIRPCCGCSYSILCFECESYSRYRCPPGSVEGNKIKSAAGVACTHPIMHQHTQTWMTSYKYPQTLTRKSVFPYSDWWGRSESAAHLLVCIFQSQLAESFAQKSDDGIRASHAKALLYIEFNT